jgi:hypothetical protein
MTSPIPVIDLAAATGPAATAPVKDKVEDYLKEFGRPAQVTAWRDAKPYVAELADNSAGR